MWLGFGVSVRISVDVRVRVAHLHMLLHHICTFIVCTFIARRRRRIDYYDSGWIVDELIISIVDGYGDGWWMDSGWIVDG